MLKRLIRDVLDGRPVVSAPATSTIRHAAEEMKRAHVAAVLVIDDMGEPVGIVTERDIVDRVVAVGLEPSATQIQTVMTRDPITMRADATVRDVLHKMYEGAVRHMPITSNDRVIGVVSMRDFISDEIAEYDHERSFARRLWETMG